MRLKKKKGLLFQALQPKSSQAGRLQQKLHFAQQVLLINPICKIYRYN